MKKLRNTPKEIKNSLHVLKKAVLNSLMLLKDIEVTLSVCVFGVEVIATPKNSIGE